MEAKLYSSTLIAHEQGIPTQYVEIENPRAFAKLPGTASEYNRCDIFILIGAGWCRMDTDDFQVRIGELGPRYAAFLSPGWADDNVSPGFRSDIFSVDTAAYGDVVMGVPDVFCFGGINRNHCGIEPRACSAHSG